ncbi:GNAT family N-acetyltransferase [Francisella sp. LA112445]|uniref:GNAT family N-acetyltransferase n=1 Tax=Francisella sp. LA112445 TaxID=1395624 RepID=UPI001788D772|nr:GNAT family N-acetyltransferase [Francisella sp. LA112445]QIW10271.1 GNAT family N-acetyltransferase [Francisella sp. LA112445]
MQTLNLDSSYFDKVISLIRLSDKDFSWSDQQILDSLSQDLTIGLIDNGKLKALAVFSCIFETAELLYICVDKSNQNQGLGAEVLRESFVYLLNQKVTEVFLEVDVNNHVAIKLYNKLGFKEISIRKNYYKKQDGSYSDALIYKLEIT